MSCAEENAYLDHHQATLDSLGNKQAPMPDVLAGRTIRTTPDAAAVARLVAESCAYR